MKKLKRQFDFWWMRKYALDYFYLLIYLIIKYIQ